jgi:hypothetical protein
MVVEELEDRYSDAKNKKQTVIPIVCSNKERLSSINLLRLDEVSSQLFKEELS